MKGLRINSFESTRLTASAVIDGFLRVSGPQITISRTFCRDFAPLPKLPGIRPFYEESSPAKLFPARFYRTTGTKNVQQFVTALKTLVMKRHFKTVSRHHNPAKIIAHFAPAAGKQISGRCPLASCAEFLPGYQFSTKALQSLPTSTCHEAESVLLQRRMI